MNFDQVEQYDPPPNPAKATDSRFRGYSAEHGDESWELDALEPTVLADLVRGGVADLMNADLYEAAQERERQGTRLLEAASRRWSELEELLGDDEPDGSDE
jgi:hypothetical protein